MNHRRAFWIVLVASLLLCTPAGAWLRSQYSDTEVTTRSELIVVGHIDKDSIRYVRHGTPPGRAESWEHHAALVVTEVLKGTLKDKKIPVVINYGLDVFVDGRRLTEDGNVITAMPDANGPGRIDIVDTGGHSFDGLENAQNDNIWCLRNLIGQGDKKDLGVLDPEDLQPLKYKEYFQALLGPEMDKRFDRLLEDKNADIVARTLAGIGQLHRPQDGPRVARLLDATDGNIQAAAARTMAEVGEQSTIELFRKALESNNADIRVEACKFLCRFRDMQSIPGIANAFTALPGSAKGSVLAYLPRMHSRQFIDVLLGQLDEHLIANQVYGTYTNSTAAAGALRELTFAQFPLDSRPGWKVWDGIKDIDEEVLLRKSIREDIELLTNTHDYEASWAAYESLGRLVNQHFGSYDAFHSIKDPVGRFQSQKLWRAWADKNLLRPRVEWIYEGFAASGIVLPKPMDANGIDILVDVLYYFGRRSEDVDANAYPKWKRDGWPQANFHRHNANLLLEWFTGHTVGIDPGWRDLRGLPWGYDAAHDRWQRWWAQNRGKVTLQPPPVEKAVTAEMIAAAPSLRAAPPPLVLVFRQDTAVAGQSPAVMFEVKNTSKEDITIQKAIYDVSFSSSNRSGTMAHGGHSPLTREDFVTLKPGESTMWKFTEPPTPAVVHMGKPETGLTYTLTYRFAGGEFGLRGWRGVLRSTTAEGDKK